MAIARQYAVIAPKIFIDGLGFGGRFDNDDAGHGPRADRSQKSLVRGLLGPGAKGGDTDRTPQPMSMCRFATTGMECALSSLKRSGITAKRRGFPAAAVPSPRVPTPAAPSPPPPAERRTAGSAHPPPSARVRVFPA